jgi:hypothetical protein
MRLERADSNSCVFIRHMINAIDEALATTYEIYSALSTSADFPPGRPQARFYSRNVAYPDYPPEP